MSVHYSEWFCTRDHACVVAEHVCSFDGTTRNGPRGEFRRALKEVSYSTHFLAITEEHSCLTNNNI